MSLTIFDKLHYQFYPNQTVNPNMEEAENETLKVAHADGAILIGDDAAVKRYRGYSIYAGFAYPTTSLDRLILITKLATILWLVDDYLNQRERANPHFIQGLKRLFNGLFDGDFEGVSSWEAGNLQFIRNTFMETEKIVPRDWFRRNLQDHLDWINASDKMNEEEINLSPMSVDDYVKLRLIDSGALPGFDFVEVAVGRFLPDEVMSHPHMERIRVLSATQTALSNDLYSYAKESLDEKLSLNYVALLLSTTSLTFEEAVDKTIQRCNDAVKEFLQLEKELLTEFGAEGDVSVVLRGYKEYIQGHMIFAQVSTRYRSNKTPFADMKKCDE